MVTVDTYLESSLDSVDQAEERVVSAAQEMGFPEEDVYRLGMAVREAMVNAVVHGNRYSANKKVHFVLRREENVLVVEMTDEGSGFVPIDQPDPLADENLLRQSGRGMMLIRAFVDEFQAQPAQPSGTWVQMKKALPPA